MHNNGQQAGVEAPRAPHGYTMVDANSPSRKWHEAR